MRTKLIVPPSIEPVTLAEVKAHARIEIDVTEDDNLLNGLISTARQFVENYIHGGLISQTWIMSLDQKDRFSRCDYITLPLKPVLSIEEVNSFDRANGEGRAFMDYYLDGNRLCLEDGAYWPYNTRQLGAVTIKFTVGYGESAADVPAPIRQAILMLVAHLYENRSALIDPLTNSPSTNVMPFSVSALLQPYRSFFIG